MTMTRKRRTTVVVVSAVVVALVLVYLVRVLWLFMVATEGDVPDASAIPLPAGAQIVNEERDCASGGCWVSVDVRPPDGQSPKELAAEIGATPQLELPGNVLDPRSVWLSAQPGDGILTIRADYWSSKYVP